MTDTRTDTRTLQQLADEAIAVQDACNLSGVVHGFSRAITRLRELIGSEPDFSTDKLNHHPICIMWADKIADLSGQRSMSACSAAQDTCYKLAGKFFTP